ncbi:XRE family transcriptional regulator [Pseudoalteromonas phenolica]|uniref:helix-turn-helix domain-containing protein n=1 Tax=Pseudoalteromonas phenolica TaxID=161398 RepID=UPI00110B33A1|nr:helix-turn-helix transcriptional regulator [Pseudoalteromonas phenolica]TMN87009.1 XRE family transcriptional regulator [Pseudoalteromonas phenolica]
MRKPSKLLLVTLSENVQKFRRENSLSQEELAELCGFHRTYIGSIERCERNVTLSTLETLSKTLNTSVPHLLSKDTQ